jgi:hypothetical protein
MKKADQYVISFQKERCRKGVARYHWTVCLSLKPDEMVSWGHAPTLELAATAARDEISDLCSGLTQGGQVKNRRKLWPALHRSFPS